MASEVRRVCSKQRVRRSRKVCSKFAECAVGSEGMQYSSKRRVPPLRLYSMLGAQGGDRPVFILIGLPPTAA